MSRVFTGQKWYKKKDKQQDDRSDLTSWLNNDKYEVENVTNYYSGNKQPVR